ncbi:hypothetical protein Vadar_005923 [Vaccinium darrowii]|uniref:Uncharacterized protein n=1 Tax=Vaccinium darrowii TaxID=229202 RepID=A0ACB7YTS4_9ERIC|nr:hypothetical protein Vadar_005923 [Vaccinium darrowii]
MNAAGSDGADKMHSKKPKYSMFTQQELPAFKPILTPGRVITLFVSIAVICIPIGLACLYASENVVEIVDRYDKDCIPSSYSTNTDDMISYIQSSTTNKTCIKKFTVPKKMKHPIYIYYQLDNFYQNHRRFVQSRSDNQLRSKENEDKVTGCLLEASNSDGPIVPCGLIAWSLFNDTYAFSSNNVTIQVNKKGIAWESDTQFKFGYDVYPKNFQSGVIGGAKLDEKIPLSEQEDLIVWMRTAVLPSFRKLYGKIEEDLDANQKITVVIQNNYNTYSFGGDKKLVLSTTTWIGGKNDYIGLAFLTVGGLSFSLAIIFNLLYLFRPRLSRVQLCGNSDPDGGWERGGVFEQAEVEPGGCLDSIELLFQKQTFEFDDLGLLSLGFSRSGQQQNLLT